MNRTFFLFMALLIWGLTNSLNAQIRRKPITPNLRGQGIATPKSGTNPLATPNDEKESKSLTEIPPIIIKQDESKKEIIIKKPENGSITVEGIAQISFGDKPIGIAFEELRGRYFASDKMAYRALVGFSVESFNEVLLDGVNRMPVLTNQQNIRAGGGVELHRPGSKHLSPYYGAEGYIIMNSNKMTVSNTRDMEKYEQGASYLQDSTVSGVYLGALAGIDYYITSDFYIGTEIAIGFSSLQRSITGERISANGNVISQTNDRSGGGVVMGISYINGIRVGYKF